MSDWREDPSLYAPLAHLLARLGPDLSGPAAALAATLRLLTGDDEAAATGARADPSRLRPRLRAALGRPDRRLAVYGTLAPGRPNHHVLAPLGGRWSCGRVRGHLASLPADPDLPVLHLEPDGAEVEVHLLTSRRLASRWPELDAFEGPAYRRTLTPVLLARRRLAVANLYAAEGSPVAGS